MHLQTLLGLTAHVPQKLTVKLFSKPRQFDR